ncbi:MAG: hypothetical protein ACRDSS_14100 [Actinocrinis sp.]
MAISLVTEHVNLAFTVVRPMDWWPDGPRLELTTTAHRLITGAVGRKS